MNSRAFALDDLTSNVEEVNVKLPADVAAMLSKEAKVQRKPLGPFVREWLEDLADARVAMRRWRAIKAGKTKTIPAAEVYKRLGI